MIVVREFLEHVLPALLLLQFVHSGGDKRHQTTSPHSGATGDDGGREGGAGVVDELTRRIETLAAMTEETGSVGLGVQVEEECTKHHGKTSVEDIETVL